MSPRAVKNCEVEVIRWWCLGQILFILPGWALCQSFTKPPDGVTCPGDRITVTCVTPSGVIVWIVTPGGGDDECSYSRATERSDMCGPDNRFHSDGSGGNSSLSVILTDDLNGTLVECFDGSIANANATGSYNICVIGAVEYPPQFRSADVTGGGEGEDKWVVSVKWSEAIVSCSGSVSQYVLCKTPLSSDGSSNLTTVETQYDLTVTSNMRYNVTIRADVCGGDVMGNESEPETLFIKDETKINTATPSFSDTSGILESITLSYGVFSLEFLGNVTNYSYTVSLSPQYLHNPGGSDDLVTNDLQTTISVPSTAIALYSPTLTVNVPGARPVYFTTQPIASEEGDLSGDTITVDINGSCYSIVSCVAVVESLITCTAYCGPSPDFASLTKTGSVTASTSGEVISVRLPPATGQEYHCIVSGSDSDGNVLYRARVMQEKSGCTVESLLDTDRDPECSKREGDMCTCTVMSSDGRYGMMYDGTSVGSTAHLFTNNNYCYNRPPILERACQDNGNWSGETVDSNDIFTARELLSNKLSDWNIGLIVVGAILFVVGLGLAVAMVVLLILRIKASLKVHWWYWIFVTVATLITLVSLILWIIFAVYVSRNEFVKGADSGKWRRSNSLCGDAGSNRVKNGLVISSFLSSLLMPIAWGTCILLMKCGLTHPSKDKKDPDGDEEDGYGMERMDEKDVYDLPSHTKPASPQPLLSAQEGSGYGKLLQPDDDPEHYGKLNHPNKKKTASVAPAASAASDGSEYGKLDQSQIPEEPGHYGKLDHSGKKKTATLHVDNSEYGKLDRSQKHGDSGHYGKLDHHVGKKKTATLPVDSSEYGKLDRSQMDESSQQYGKLDQSTMAPTALPPGAPGAGYGKLDRQMQVKSGGGGDVYDEVTNAPRHIPSTKRKPPDH